MFHLKGPPSSVSPGTSYSREPKDTPVTSSAGFANAIELNRHTTTCVKHVEVVVVSYIFFLFSSSFRRPED